VAYLLCKSYVFTNKTMLTRGQVPVDARATRACECVTASQSGLFGLRVACWPFPRLRRVFDLQYRQT
jgi:hypothetical protein